jgi:hypothetical protein
MTSPKKEVSKIYDNSMLSGYKGCPRYYQLRYKKHWRSEGTSMPLVFGLSWHAGQDAVWQYARKLSGQDELVQAAMASFLETWEAEGLSADLDMEQLERYAPRTPQVAQEMYAGYIETRWNMLMEAQVLAIEQPFAVPMPGREDTWYVGRLDKVVEFKGQKLVLEHKTTTAYKKDGGFQSSYVNSWNSDSQVKGYQFGGGLYFPGLSQVWVDAALVHKKEHNHFRFIPIAHQINLIEEWIKDTGSWIERLEADARNNYFPKSEGNCFGKYGECSMLSICQTTPDHMLPEEAPAGYTMEEWKPFDILKLEKLNAGE